MQRSTEGNGPVLQAAPRGRSDAIPGGGAVKLFRGAGLDFQRPPGQRRGQGVNCDIHACQTNADERADSKTAPRPRALATRYAILLILP